MIKIIAGEAVLDYGIYPRTSINHQHVSEIAEALRAGQILPPIVIDRNSRKVIDGFHRVTAHLNVFGSSSVVEADDRDYPDEIEMFLDSIKFNTSHGLNLSKYDQTKVVLKLQELKIEPERIADSLRIRMDAVEQLILRKTASGQGGEAVPLKRTASHLKGQFLTPRQEEANRRASGQTAIFHANQLINAVKGDLVDWSNPVVSSRLFELMELLQSHQEL